MSESTASSRPVQIGTEKVGARVYVTGNTYPVKIQLKALGCHWDPDRKQWWIGAAKAASVQALVAEAAAGNVEAPPENLGEKRVLAKVSYKGRNYFVIGDNGDRVRLVTLDEKLDFWADKADCELLKNYEPREERGAYGRTTGRKVYTTLGSIQDFVRRQEAAKERGEPACPVCGVRGELVHDLEDGIDKCRKCCDMPADEC